MAAQWQIRDGTLASSGLKGTRFPVSPEGVRASKQGEKRLGGARGTGHVKSYTWEGAIWTFEWPSSFIETVPVYSRTFEKRDPLRVVPKSRIRSGRKKKLSGVAWV